MTTAFRILDPFQVYTDLDGNLASGGTLHFYAAGTTTEGTTTDADVYGDEDLSVNNGPTIAIGTDGRAVNDIWGDGTLSYRCRVYASDGTLIRDRDNIGLPGSGSASLPAMVNGEFLTTDGSNWLMAAIRQMLDPTGQNNKIIGSDGTNAVWVDKPANGAAGTDAAVTVGTTAFKWNGGSGDFALIQMGSATASASGTKSTSKSITFGTAFAAAPKVFVMPKNGGCSDSSVYPKMSTTPTATGCTINFGQKTGGTSADDFSGANIINDIDFDWVAFGTVAS